MQLTIKLPEANHIVIKSVLTLQTTNTKLESSKIMEE